MGGVDKEKEAKAKEGMSTLARAWAAGKTRTKVRVSHIGEKGRRPKGRGRPRYRGNLVH